MNAMHRPVRVDDDPELLVGAPGTTEAAAWGSGVIVTMWWIGLSNSATVYGYRLAGDTRVLTRYPMAVWRRVSATTETFQELSAMADRHLIDVHILLADSGRLLLTRRGGTDEFAGRWHLPSGKLEKAEAITAAAAREAHEEVGVMIDPADLRVVHVAHVADSGPEPRLGVFLHAARWQGEPMNREPDKCLAVAWFGFDELPEDIIEYPAIGIRAFLDGDTALFSEYGWTLPTVA